MEIVMGSPMEISMVRLTEILKLMGFVKVKLTDSHLEILRD